MGAHNAATLDVAQRRTEAVRDWLQDWNNDEDREWVRRIDQILTDGATSGTLKRWMQEHHGQVVDTFQTTILVVRDGRPVTEPKAPWAPRKREVDATRATCVLLDGSRRDYDGVTTFLTTQDGYIGFARWGSDSVQMLVYVA